MKAINEPYLEGRFLFAELHGRMGELLAFIFELFLDAIKPVTFGIAFGSDHQLVHRGSLHPLGCQLIKEFTCFGCVCLV